MQNVPSSYRQESNALVKLSKKSSLLHDQLTNVNIHN